jgi:hypothetical protein
MTPLSSLAGIFILIYLGILPQAVGGCLWAAGWIVEGFLTPHKSE